MTHLRYPLENILKALSSLTVMGHPIASLDEDLARAITEAVQALNVPEKTLDADVVQRLRSQARTFNHAITNALAVDFKTLGSDIERLLGADTTPEADMAYCIGCGTYPKGPYTCATCSEAERYEGEPKFISDWPERI